MITKKTGRKLLMLFACTFFIMLLTGCVNVSTELEIDGDSFSGERVMSVSFDVDELMTRLPSGIDGLNEQIDESIPSQLSYTYDVDDDAGEAVYKFTLSFDSKQDYIDQLGELLDETPEVTFTYSTGAFTRGIVYNENFESRDLLAWFDDILLENGLASATQGYTTDNFWTQTGVTVVLDGEEYTCDGGTVDIESGGQSVVSSISVSTDITSSTSISRTIVVAVSDAATDTQMSLIEGYFNDVVPDSGSWSKSSSSDGISYVIQLNADSFAKLQSYMEKFTSGESQCSFQEYDDFSQPLAESSAFTEYIDLSYFAGESDVPVTYEVKTSDYEVYQISVSRADDEDVEVADTDESGSKLAYSGSLNSATFTTIVRNVSYVSSVEYNLIQSGKDRFVREIIITLESGVTSDVLENIAYYYNIKGAGNTSILVENDDDAPKVTIYISGTSSQLIAAEAVLFGGVGARALSYDSDWGVYTLHPDTTLVDSFDITSLLNVMGVDKFEYTYSNDDVTITKIVESSSGEQAEETVEGDSNFIYVALDNGIQTISVNGYYFNGWAVFFIILTVLLVLLLIALAVLVYLYKTGRIKLPVKEQKEDEKPEETQPMPLPEEVKPVYPLPEPEPRNLTDGVFDDEAETEPLDFSSHIEPEEPEPEEEETEPAEPNMDPFLSFPAKEIAPEPEPEPEPEIIEELVVERSVSDDYTDSDMIDDFKALGHLEEYKRRIQKVKIKVRKQKNDE